MRGPPFHGSITGRTNSYRYESRQLLAEKQNTH